MCTALLVHAGCVGQQIIGVVWLQVDADGGIAGRVSSSPALVRPGRGGSPLLMRCWTGWFP